MDKFRHLLGLRGYWPMSAVGVSGKAPDFSGNGLDLSASIAIAYQLGKFVRFSSVSDLLYLDNALLDITGTETYIASDERGLTLGGWFSPDGVAAPTQSLVSKWGESGFRSYNLSLSGPLMNLSISDDGASYTTSGGGAVVASQWQFLAGRFVPGQTQTVWINGLKIEQVTTRAAINNSSAAFHVGSSNETTPRVSPGGIAQVFLCAAALSDDVVRQLFELSRGHYGV